MPDLAGWVLFPVSSYFACVAVAHRFWSRRPGRWDWWIAWLNMTGSVFFMASAIGSYVLRSTGAMLNVQWANLGTFLGAVCFLLGAALMLPAWSSETRAVWGRNNHSGRPSACRRT